MFYSASKLTVASQINDTWLSLASVYVQIVPNSRSEVATVDQRPARKRCCWPAHRAGWRWASRPIPSASRSPKKTLARYPCSAASPPPFGCAPPLLSTALGQLYTISDDGTGRMTGAGGGALSLLTGALSVTLNAVPDIGSCINISHGSRVSYTDRSARGQCARP